MLSKGVGLYRILKLLLAPFHPAVRVREFVLPASLLLTFLSSTSFNEAMIPEARSCGLKMTLDDLVVLLLLVAGNGLYPENFR
jgi:hypothetical protein